MAARAVILGCAGPTLDAEEAAFFRDADPFGFIVFARNITDPGQIAALTADLRAAVGRDAPVLIDQEGGRVARMRPPHWQGWSPVRDFCDAIPREIDRLEALFLRYRLIAVELAAAGIDVNCVPVLDVPAPGAHPVIGNRALGSDPTAIALRGREVAAGLLAGGVLPVLKHLPGHGRAMADSHEALPVAQAPLPVLEEDFLPFTALRDLPIGMTAHMVYPDIDPDRPATLSPAVIALIRERIGFRGLLLTDDLSMKALTGPFQARAAAAIAAGCDILLHCNGDRGEMAEVLSAAPDLAGVALARAEAALAARRPAAGFDPVAARARLATLTGEAALA